MKPEIVPALSRIVYTTAFPSGLNSGGPAKEAHALNNYSDEYVCFADDNDPSFAVIARVNDLIEELKKQNKIVLKALMAAKDALVVQGYYKGVKNGDLQILNPSGTNGSDYGLEFIKPLHGKLEYSINWATGRYRFKVYDLTRRGYVTSIERTGKCELIHSP